VPDMRSVLNAGCAQAQHPTPVTDTPRPERQHP
jgi:hypothetical protein